VILVPFWGVIGTAFFACCYCIGVFELIVSEFMRYKRRRPPSAAAAITFQMYTRVRYSGRR